MAACDEWLDAAPRDTRDVIEAARRQTHHVDLGRFNEHGYEPRRPFRPARGRIRLHVSVQGAYYEADADRPELWRAGAFEQGEHPDQVIGTHTQWRLVAQLRDDMQSGELSSLAHRCG